MSVTISKIAKLANVSRTTVSYVLNNKGHIPQTTRDKVLEVIKETGYLPNNNARNLAIGKNLRIGIFVPSAEYLRKSVFFSEISAAILSAINQHGMDLIIEIYENVYERWLLNSAGVDGAILINPESDEEYIKWLQAAKIPVIVVGNADAFEDIAFVDGPNIESAYAMTQKVIEYGHRNLLYILPSERYTLTNDFLKGIGRALEESGQDVRVLYGYTEYGKDIQEEVLQGYFDSMPDITAVIVDSDYKAVQVLSVLKNMGKRVPEDVSLTCLSGSYLTDIPTPRIYSMKPDNSQIGEMAANRLIDIIEGRTENAQQNVYADYVIEEGDSFRRLTEESYG